MRAGGEENAKVKLAFSLRIMSNFSSECSVNKQHFILRMFFHLISLSDYIAHILFSS